MGASCDSDEPGAGWKTIVAGVEASPLPVSLLEELATPESTTDISKLQK